MAVRLKRAYEQPSRSDGRRYLVERLWPRGVRRDDLQLSGWLKELAPSTELRRWYGHVSSRWLEFADAYRNELAAPQRQDLLRQVAAEAANGPVTLVFSTRDEQHSGASVLRDAVRDLTESEAST